MKKYALLILGIIILGVILYLTLIIAVLEIAVGAIILLVVAGILWWLWRSIKEKLD